MYFYTYLIVLMSLPPLAQARWGWRGALAAAIGIGWLIMPIGVGILLGMLLAFVMQPLYGRLKPRLGVAWSALVVVMGSTFALAGGVFSLAWLGRLP